jgi:hypothetical protein
VTRPRRTVGFDHLFAVFRTDCERGTTYRLNDVAAGSGTTVWTAGFVCLPDSSDPCPPSAGKSVNPPVNSK